MRHNFQLPDFPDSNFEIETSIWTGRSKLFMDNFPIEQSNEIGKPFLIPTPDGCYIKAFARQSVTGIFVSTLEINGKQNHIVENLKWFEYVLGCLPLLLIFTGGRNGGSIGSAIGGAIGSIAAVTTFSIFIQEGNQTLKYIKIAVVVAGSFLLYFLFANYIWKLIN